MNNKDLTLVIMAAGMGSRFGGLKQIEPVGPNDEFIIDYSVYDAIKAGFNKIVFIIKKENYDVFKETIGKRVEDKIKVEYAFQDSILEYNGKTYEREKPWGTAHAIYSVKDIVKGNFLVINSDDFYGRDAYLKAIEFFGKNKNEKEFAIVGYQVKNTLTENGSVKRGVCEVENDKLSNIKESKVEIIDNKIIASPLNGDMSFEVTEDTLVSMNVLLFTPYVFELIDRYFDKFINDLENNYEKEEYLIPDVLKKAINEKIIDVNVIKTSAKWEGVTYKEDKPALVDAINKLIDSGEYNKNLWQD